MIPVKGHALHLKNRNNKGISLFIVMLFTALVISGITIFWNQQNKMILDNKVKVAAWEGAQIARAARLHVRNLIASTVAPVGSSPRQVVATAAAASPQITIAQLIAENLLPPNFLNGRTTNALGQNIVIYMQNYPVNGLVTDDNTVPTAYVYFRQNPALVPNVESTLMAKVSAHMNRFGLMISAPIYNAAGAIVGNLCNGAASVAYWDTGCLTNADATTIAGTGFQQGGLLIPAWRSVTFDTRILMRFPQPEQSGLNTMLVDLFMGEKPDPLTVPPPTIGNSTSTAMASVDIAAANLPDPEDDDPATGTDNRRSILRPGTITTDNLIIDAQAGNDVYTYTGTPLTKAEANNTLTVPGNVISNGGDIGARGTSVNISGNTTTGRNLYVSGAVPVTATIGNLTVDSIEAGTARITNTVTTAATLSNENAITNVGNLTVQNGGAGRLGINTMTASGNTSFNFTNLDLAAANTNNLTVTGTTASPYKMAARQLNTTGLLFTGNADVVSSDGSSNPPAILNGTTTVWGRNDITSGGSAWCQGDCPQRSKCQNFAADGFTSYAACIASF